MEQTNICEVINDSGATEESEDKMKMRNKIFDTYNQNLPTENICSRMGEIEQIVIKCEKDDFLVDEDNVELKEKEDSSFLKDTLQDSSLEMRQDYVYSVDMHFLIKGKEDEHFVVNANQNGIQSTSDTNTTNEWENQFAPEEQNSVHCSSQLEQFGSMKKPKSVHNIEKRHICDVCKKTFKRSFDFKKHKRIHTGEKPYECDVCHKTFAECGNLNQHKRIHSDKKSVPCDECEMAFTNKRELKRHKRTHLEENPYTCEICQKKFRRLFDFKKHKRIHSGERPYACEICRKTFTEFGNLNQHKRTHSGVKPYSCDICPKTFTHVSNLNLHKRSHNGEKPFTCEICQLTFSSKSYLIIHERIHNNIRPFVCDICPKTFKASQHLKNHKRVHTGEKPFACDVCFKRFSKKATMKKHRVRHGDDVKQASTHQSMKNYNVAEESSNRIKTEIVDSDDKNLLTDEQSENMFNDSEKIEQIVIKCEKDDFYEEDESNEELIMRENTFSLQDSSLAMEQEHVHSFDRHSAMKGKEDELSFFTANENDKYDAQSTSFAKRHVCDICQKIFKRIFDLKKHKRIHSGEKPYVCDICQKTFTEMGNLNQHKRIHTGKKPYTCEVCQKTFNQISNLNKHKIMHHRIQPYTCDVCQRTFTHIGNLKQHRVIHKNKSSLACDIKEEIADNIEIDNNSVESHVSLKYLFNTNV